MNLQQVSGRLNGGWLSGLRRDLNYKFLTGIPLLLFALLYLSSCSPAPYRSVQLPGTSYVTASWYGPKFHGKPTASGKKFNMYAMTCAHKVFPFGVRLRVTNLRNNKSVAVTVNDRGPFIAGRDLDLSYAAAREIGLVKQGVGRVKIQYLGRDMSYVKDVIPVSTTYLTGPFTIQIGSFRERFNAERLKKALKLKYRNVYISVVYINGQKFYRVRIGSFDRRDSASALAKILAEEGYNIIITGKD